MYIFFWIPYWQRMLINILWPLLGANKDGRPIWGTGSILAVEQRTVGLSCTKPITTKHQSVFWLVSQSEHMLAIFVGTCRWISLAAASDHPAGDPL